MSFYSFGTWAIEFSYWWWKPTFAFTCIVSRVCSFSWYRRLLTILSNLLKKFRAKWILWVEWEHIKEEDCGFVAHFPGPWSSVLLRTGLCLSLLISFLQNTGSFLHCGIFSGASWCLADVEYQKWFKRWFKFASPPTRKGLESGSFNPCVKSWIPYLFGCILDKKA